MRIGMTFLPGYRISWFTWVLLLDTPGIQEGVISTEMVALNLKGKPEAEISTTKNPLMAL